MSRVILFGLALLAFLVVPFAVRAQDDLGNFRQRQEIAAQKLTAQVADALSASRRLEKTEPREAKFLLQRTMTQVKDSKDLTLEKCASLERQLQTRIREIDNSAAARRADQDLKPYSQKPTSRAPTNDEPRNSASSVIRDFQAPAKTAAKINQDAIRTRELNTVRVFSSLEKGPVYPTDDRPIVFPSKDVWDRITARGKIQLSAKEVALLRALNSVMSVNFDGDKFGTVINYLQEKTGINMMFDQASVEEARLDYEDLVTYKIPGKMEVRSIFKKVLGDKGLTYIIKEGALHVMTPKKARETVIVRSYPISDLIQPGQNAMMFGPFVARAQMLQNVQQIMNLIQTQVDPTYWDPNGPGRIGFYEPTKSLVITGSAEMHYQLGGMNLLGGR